MSKSSIIDKKDVAILQELDQNVRASYIQIAKRTGLSKEVVQYRIRRLEEKNIITGYWALPNINSEHTIYKLLIKNKSLGEVKKKEFIEFTKQQRCVSWFANTEGNWDFIITSFITQDTQFTIFVQELMKRFGKYFKEKTILKCTSAIMTNEKFLYAKDHLKRLEADDFTRKATTRDAIDKQIIQILANNARSSFAQIAKQVNLTAESVSNRFKKILKEKLITALNLRVNFTLLGKAYYHLFIEVNDYDKKERIAQYYTQHKDCTFMMKHIGFYDIHLEIVIDEDKIESFIEELTEHFGESINSYELLKIRKEHLLIVTR